MEEHQPPAERQRQRQLSEHHSTVQSSIQADHNNIASDCINKKESTKRLNFQDISESVNDTYGADFKIKKPKLDDQNEQAKEPNLDNKLSFENEQAVINTTEIRKSSTEDGCLCNIKSPSSSLDGGQPVRGSESSRASRRPAKMGAVLDNVRCTSQGDEYSFADEDEEYQLDQDDIQAEDSTGEILDEIDLDDEGGRRGTLVEYLLSGKRKGLCGHSGSDTTSREDYSETASKTDSVTEKAKGFIYASDFSDYHLPKEAPKVNLSSSDEMREFDSVILGFMKEQGIPGASLCVSRKGKILYTQTYGWATHGVAVRPDHRFRIASVTKSITSVGVLRLVEEEKLKLTDKVFGPNGLLREYSPTVEGDRRVLRITVRHLLQHSGGWDREEVGDPVFWRHVAKEMNVEEPATQHTLITYMMSKKLQFSPGTKHAYSNLGYEVLGRIIERVTGQTYVDYMKDVLREAGITRMMLGRTKKEDTQPDEVEYFASPKFSIVDSILPGEGQVPAPYGGFAMETGDADGGWIATATDLVKYFNALDGSTTRLVKPETFKLMIERPSYGRGSAWYGFGLDVSWYRKAWEHSGTLDGATSSLVRDKNGFTFAFLANFWPPDSDYTSLISYAITRVQSWSKVKKIDIPYADGVTLDKKYIIKVKTAVEEFGHLDSIFSCQGYQPCWISGYEFREQTFLNIIWSNEKRDCVVHPCLTEKEFCESLQECREKGYRLCHIDTFLRDCEICYAVIYVRQNRGLPWLVYHNLSVSELEQKIKDLKEQGYYISRQSITNCGDSLKSAALFEKSDISGCWPKFGLSSSKYQKDFNSHARYGHLLSYVKPYRHGNGPRFCTIWTNPGPYTYTSEYEMSQYRLLNDFLLTAEKKFEPLCIGGYEEDGAHKFVAVCIKQVLPKSV